MAPTLATAPPHPPGSSAVVREWLERLRRPIERFIQIEAASGVVLLVAALAALLWANSPWGASYERLWAVPLGVRWGARTFVEPLRFWIDEGLMTIFFFVVGLEIRREMHEGELSTWRRAALPAVAALGGMLVPAGIYAALNGGGPAARGWGVPMATDIAFAAGALTLLSRRVPAPVRVFLLTLAVVDDIGAIVVIALFYSGHFAPVGLAVAGAGFALVLLLRAMGARGAFFYVAAGCVAWGGLLAAGVHPTLAGVGIGLLTPVRAWFGWRGFVGTVRSVTEATTADAHPHDLLKQLDRVRRARREALPPVVVLESKLHPWVAFGVMPLFAFANAGVHVGSIARGPAALTMAAGIVLGLVVGKPLGIFAFSWIASRIGLATPPSAAAGGWRGVAVAGTVGGVGFTMAMFIAELAFDERSALLDTAKLSILAGTAIASVVAMTAGRALLPVTESAGPAPS